MRRWETLRAGDVTAAFSSGPGRLSDGRALLADAADDDVLSFASFGIELTPLNVSVLGIQPSRRRARPGTPNGAQSLAARRRMALLRLRVTPSRDPTGVQEAQEAAFPLRLATSLVSYYGGRCVAAAALFTWRRAWGAWAFRGVGRRGRPCRTGGSAGTTLPQGCAPCASGGAG